MDSNPLNFIEIIEVPNKPSKYDLKIDELEELLEPIKDIPVVVIPIVGPSRLGKSFILSYMSRFLTDPKNINWIGKGKEELKGFEWKSSTGSVTFGLWVSKPFVLKQSNGKEIAVLLIDTQGVFDRKFTERDWATIVGISLLMSSCLVFNVFTHIQDNILMTLKSFLDYGLLAAKSNKGSKDQKPFQSLMFLIRDWNTPSDFKFGLTGGNKYQKELLKVEEGQSSSAKSSRLLLNECFVDVSSFLMPHIGEQIYSKDFNGSVDHLSPRFTNKMKEFITHLLNPEELKPKCINNNPINGQQLIEYIKTYVQIFNSDELPRPIDIIEATSKTSDIIQINKLKELHSNQLKSFIKSKPFVARKALESHNKQLRTETIETFEGLMRSENKEVIKELNEMIESHLNSNYEPVVYENERRREQVLRKAVEDCGTHFMETITDRLDSHFMEPFVLDELLKSLKKEVLIDFKQNFGEEEEELFAKDLLNLNKSIETSESSIKAENHRRIAEAEKNNAGAVNEAIDLYRRDMKSVLDQNVFLSKDRFNGLEKQINDNYRQLFSDNCSSGDSKFKKRFQLEFDQRLNETKDDFKRLNQTKCERIVIQTEKELNNSIDEYNQKLMEITSEEDLIERHEDLKQYCLDQFKDHCPHNESAFLDKYLETFENKISKYLNDFKTKLIERKERIENLIKTTISGTKEVYIKKMETEIRDKMYSNQELDEIHEKAKNEAILHFESRLTSEIPVIGFDIEIYLSELNQFIDEEFDKFVEKNKFNKEFKQKDLEVISNELLDSYESKMEKIIDSAENETQLTESHEQLKKDILKEFTDNNPFPDITSFDPYLEKLDKKIEKSLEDFLELFELQLKDKESVANNLTADVRKYYKEEMDKYYQNTSFLRKEKLQKNNELVLKTTIDRFESKRGNISYEVYKKLIEDSVIDIFEQIEAENDMNTPTLPAIGIDLGTTNSCVAFFKPDRRNNNTVNVIPDESGHNVTPSVVSIRDNIEEVGHVAKKNINIYPRNTIYSAKRLIGKQFTDTSVQNYLLKNYFSFNVVDDGNNNPKINVTANGIDSQYFAEQISSKVLKKLKEVAEVHLGCQVTKAVITVPAYFNDSQKEATKDAGKLAGLEVLKIINEPTAAAIAFRLNRSQDLDSRKVLIYDFGGGTFDVAVLVIDRGNIEVKAVGGDNDLGGDDIDTNVMDYCLDEFRAQTGLTVNRNQGEGPQAISRLRTACEEHKCNLSSTHSTTISIDAFYGHKDLNVVLTRDMFEQLNDGLFTSSLDVVAQTLEDAAMTHSDINDIVLVGGTTRIPRIQELLSDQFGGRPLNHVVNPDEAVAVGAAIQAAILNGQQAQGFGHLKVLDVAPMSLGVEILGGFMSTIIFRNSRVPDTYEQLYVTTADYQTSVDVKIYEGEEPIAKDNRLLGRFEVTGIPSAPKGDQSIKITFEITDEGILRVNAKIVSTGGEKEIEIKEHKGRLSDQELEQLIAQGN